MKFYYRFIAMVMICAVVLTGCIKKPPVEVTIPTPSDSEHRTDPVPRPVDPSQGKVTISSSIVIAGIKNDNLGYPIAAHQDQAGNTYILDIYSSDGLIKVFDPQGKYLTKSIPLQSPDSQPVNFALDSSGHLYIADLGMGVVQKFDGDELLATLQPQEDFYPRSIVVDSKGNLFVVSFDKIFKITPEGNYSFFGKSGDGDGEFGAAGSEFYMGPSDICLDRDDNIYIADTLNHRVQKFDNQGGFLAAFPLGENVSPQGIWVNPTGEIYVASQESLIKLDTKGTLQKEIDVIGFGGEAPNYYGIAGGENGTLLVVIPERHQVKVFSQDVEVYSIKGDTGEGFIYPHDIEVYGQNIAIVAGDPFYKDEMNNRAVVFDQEGKFVTHLLSDFGIGSFLSPRSVAFLDDRLYVLDLDIISVFSPEGRFITSFGGRGSDPGDFGVYDNYGQEEGPFAMIKSRTGGLWVSDTYNSRVQSIDKAGNHQGGFGVDYPGAIAEDAEGNIYVVAAHKAVITKYSPSGEKLLEFGKPGQGDGEFTLENLEGLTLGPCGIAVDHREGLIYISDTEAHRLQVFDKEGNFVKTLGGFGKPGEEGFFHPRGIIFDDKGFLWVADTGNHRVVKLDVK